MQLVLPWLTSGRRPTRVTKAPSVLQVGAEAYPITITRHRRARRYVLRIAADGGLRLTVPRGASIEGGLAFAQTQGDWIRRERLKRSARQRPWESGTLIWFRGAQVPLTVSASHISVAPELVCKSSDDRTVRASVELHLREVATRELPPRCLELAALHGLTVGRVSVRNQRSRWGSCSSKGTIALNWRLVQMPASVSDYVILHELMHIKQPNHSRQFWREVAAVCEHWREAERWLSKNGRDLL